MKASYIFNPFMKFSERSLLIAGIVCMLLASWIGAVFHVIYDGVINIHIDDKQTFFTVLAQNVIAVLMLAAFLYGIGFFINRRTRIADVLTTALVFRIPLYVVSLMFPFTEPILKKIQSKDDIAHLNLSGYDMAVLTFFGFISIALLAYAIALLINGFKTATNAKKWYHILILIIGLLIADLLAKMIITRIFL